MPPTGERIVFPGAVLAQVVDRAPGFVPQETRELGVMFSSTALFVSGRRN